MEREQRQRDVQDARTLQVQNDVAKVLAYNRAINSHFADSDASPSHSGRSGNSSEYADSDDEQQNERRQQREQQHRRLQRDSVPSGLEFTFRGMDGASPSAEATAFGAPHLRLPREGDQTPGGSALQQALRSFPGPQCS